MLSNQCPPCFRAADGRRPAEQSIGPALSVRGHTNNKKDFVRFLLHIMAVAHLVGYPAWVYPVTTKLAYMGRPLGTTPPTPKHMRNCHTQAALLLLPSYSSLLRW